MQNTEERISLALKQQNSIQNTGFTLTESQRIGQLLINNPQQRENLHSSQLSQSSYKQVRSVSQSMLTSQAPEYKLSRFHEKGLHKRFLGKELDVVCFLLAVEVERLYEENFNQKQKFEQLESLQIDRKHYDEHINELNEKLNQYQTNMEILIEENQQLKIQIEEWQKSCAFLKMEKEKEIDQYRQRFRQYEEELLEMRTYKDKYYQLEEKIVLQTTEIERSQHIIGQKNEEINQYRNRLQQLEATTITQENELKKLKLLLEAKDRESSEWRERCSQLSIQIQQMDVIIQKQKQWEYELNNLKQYTDQKEKENQEWRQKYGELYQGYEQLRGLQGALIESQNKNKQLADEVERINKLFELKCIEIEEWKNKYTKSEIELAHYKQLEEKLKEYENRIVLVTQENERKSIIINQKDNEIDQLRVACAHYEEERRQFQLNQQEQEMKIQHLVQQLNQYQETFSQYEKYIDEFKQRNGKLEIELRAAQQKITEYENRVVLLTQEIERLNNLNSQKKQESEELRQKIGKLEQQLLSAKVFEDRCKDYEQKLIGQNAYIDELKKNCQKYEEQIIQLRLFQSKCQEYESKIVLLTQEIERLNNVIKSKLQEIEEWRQRVNQYEIQLTKMRGYEQKIVEYENRIALLSSEIERLNGLLKSKMQEVEEYRSKCNQYEYQLNACEGKIKEYENRIVMMSQEIERLSNLVKQKQQEIDELNFKYYQIQEAYNELDRKFQMLTRERETLSNYLRDKSEEIEQWKNRCAKLQATVNELRNLEQTIAVLNQEIDRLNDELNMLRQENQQLKFHYVEQNTLQNKINELTLVCVLTFAETESLRSRMKEKEREVDEIRRSSLAPYRR